MIFWSEKIDNFSYPSAPVKENGTTTDFLAKGARDQSAAENLKEESWKA